MNTEKKKKKKMLLGEHHPLRVEAQWRAASLLILSQLKRQNKENGSSCSSFVSSPHFGE